MKKINLTFALILLSIYGIAQSYMPHGADITPRGEIHALVIFVGFTEQDASSNTPDWQFDQLPNWVGGPDNDLFNEDPNNIGTHDNISKWFYDMSMGKLKFTATVFPELIRVPQYLPGTTNQRTSTAIHGDVVAQINANYPNYDYSSFDERKSDPDWQFDNSLYSNTSGDPAEPDGEIDYTIFVHRNGAISTGNTTTSAVAGIGSGYTFNGLNSKDALDGFTLFRVSSAKRVIDLFAHEFGHQCMRAAHMGGANNVVGDRFHMNCAPGFTSYKIPYLTANAWERWILDWHDISHDLSNSSQNGTYTISDFVTTGDAIRIKLPNVNQYLWIENHQQFNVFDKSIYETHTDGTPVPAPEKGLLMYVENVKDSRNGSMAYSSSYSNGLQILYKSGHYDYSRSPNFTIESQYHNQKAYDFTTIAPNPYGEHHPLTFLKFDYNSSGQVGYDDNYNTPNQNGGPDDRNEHVPMFRRDGLVFNGWDAEGLTFTSGDKISIGKNPAIKNIQNYNETTERTDPINLNNISIEVISIDPVSGNAEISIQFNDHIINDDCRWTGNLELKNDQDLAINNPMRISMTNESTMFLDQSLTAMKRHSVVHEDGTYRYTFPTYLSLDSGTETVIEDGSEIRVRQGSTIILRNGSNLKIEGAGKLIIEEGSYICVENGAIINLQDLESQIIIEEEGKAGKKLSVRQYRYLRIIM